MDNHNIICFSRSSSIKFKQDLQNGVHYCYLNYHDYIVILSIPYFGLFLKCLKFLIQIFGYKNKNNLKYYSETKIVSTKTT